MRSYAVIFDLGGVVLSWDPRRAYERVLPAVEVSTFLERVNFAGWNRLNDGGRLFEEAEQELIARFPVATERFGILRRFHAIVVSGTEGLLKPEPEFYQLALDRHGLSADSTVFIDDIPANVDAVATLGMAALNFTDA